MSSALDKPIWSQITKGQRLFLVGITTQHALRQRAGLIDLISGGRPCRLLMAKM